MAPPLPAGGGWSPADSGLPAYGGPSPLPPQVTPGYASPPASGGGLPADSGLPAYGGPPPLPAPGWATTPPPQGAPVADAGWPGGADPYGQVAPPRLPDPGALPSPARLPDPGALPEPAALHVTEVTRTYPCQACGAPLVFDPTSQQLRCPACGNTLAIQGRPPQPLAKHDLGSTMRSLAALRAQAPATLEKEIVCQACGGHTRFTGSMTALRCPYCNTPIQRDDLKDAPARLAVDGVIPFRVDERTARAQIEQWINSRWFAPNEFKKYRELGSFSSVYLAYFGYDADTTTQYSGQRGEHYYVTVGSGNDQRQERRTRWYVAGGVVTNQFVDVSGLANTGLDTGKVQQLEPWPMEYATPYQQEYIAGHLSRTYDNEPDQVFDTLVQPQLDAAIEATIRSDIGGDEQQISSKSITWNLLQFAHVLLPVWLLTVTYNQRPFQVFINGATGEVQGQRPYSKVKIALAVIAAVIVALVLYVWFGR